MKSIYFITGVNGVGKTTLIDYLKLKLDQNFQIRDFDERGVPENVDHQWRINETKFWLEVAINNSKNKLTTVVCGLALPSEIENIETVGFILLDVSEETLRIRLSNRFHSQEKIAEIERVSGKPFQQFVEDNINFASVLRDEAKKFAINIIPTDDHTPEQIADKVKRIILDPQID